MLSFQRTHSLIYPGSVILYMDHIISISTPYGTSYVMNMKS
jgi:hypothetical protein